jgi:prenylcysteine oxidase / farnesylcysteine lyase
MRCFALVLLFPTSLAFQFPFKVPFITNAPTPFDVEEPSIVESPRVAIIGAGAAGSSAAFWISKAKERYGLDVEIDVYEKEDYIGGRTLHISYVS